MAYTPDLTSLRDTAIVSPVNTQLLKFNGSKWINSLINLQDLFNVPALPVTGDDWFLSYNRPTDTLTWESPLINIGAASQSILTWNNSTRTLDIDQITVSKVYVDSTGATSMSNWVSANYTGIERQEGDIQYLPSATGGTQVWIHNGGTSGTINDFTQLNVASGAMSSFTVTGNSGTPQSISDAQTLTIQGSNGIVTTGVNTNIIQIKPSIDPPTGTNDTYVWAWNDDTNLFEWLESGTLVNSIRFTDLLDTPNAIVPTDSNKLLTANTAGDALIFRDFANKSILFANTLNQITEDPNLFTYDRLTNTMVISDADGSGTDRTISLNPFESSFTQYENSLGRVAVRNKVRPGILTLESEGNSTIVNLKSKTIGLGGLANGAELQLAGMGGNLTATTPVNIGDVLGSISVFNNTTKVGAVRWTLGGSATNNVSFFTDSSVTPSVKFKEDGDIQFLNYSDTRNDSTSYTPNSFLYVDNNGNLLAAPVSAVVTSQNFAITDLTLNANRVHTFDNFTMRWANNTSANALFMDAAARFGFGTNAPSYVLDVNTTTAIRLPRGTTAQRPLINEGIIRFNTETTFLEYYNGSSWVSVGQAENFFTTDLTSTGNRSHDLGAFSLTINSTARANALSIDTDGNVALGGATSDYSLSVLNTDAILLPKGTTAERPATTTSGLLRYNTTSTNLEFHNGTVWSDVGTNFANANLVFTGPRSHNMGVFSYSMGPTSNPFAFAISSTGRVGFGTVSPFFAVDIVSTDAIRIPVGTTGQQPLLPFRGAFRYNSTDEIIEWFNGTAWTRPIVTPTVDTNFGISNITFTGTRTHTLGSNDLTLSTTGNANSFYLNGTSGNVSINTNTTGAGLTVSNTVPGESPLSVIGVNSSGQPLIKVIMPSSSSSNFIQFLDNALSPKFAVGSSGQLDVYGTIQSQASDLVLSAQGNSTIVMSLNATAEKFAVTNGGTTNYFKVDRSRNGNSAIHGEANSAYSLVINSTNAIKLPVGTTAQQPTGAAGLLRFNSTISELERHNGTSWDPITTGSTVLTATYVGFGSGANALTGTDNLIYTNAGTTPLLTLGNATAVSSKILVNSLSGSSTVELLTGGKGAILTGSNIPRWSAVGDPTAIMGIDWYLAFNAISSNTGAGLQMDRWGRIGIGTSITNADGANNVDGDSKIGFYWRPRQEVVRSYGVTAVQFDTNNGNIALFATNTSFGGRNYELNSGQTTTGLDGYVLTFNEGSGLIELQATGAAPNFANTDLAFAGSRLHSMGSNDLTLGTTGKPIAFKIQGSSGKVAIGTGTFAGALNIAGNIGTDIGTQNLLIGTASFGAWTSGNINFLYGDSNGALVTTSNKMFVFGSGNVNGATTISNSLIFGTGNFSTSAAGPGNSVAIGESNFSVVATGNYNFAMGTNNASSSTTSTYTVGIGSSNFNNAILGNHRYAFGASNFVNRASGDYLIGFGFENNRNGGTGVHWFLAGAANLKSATSGNYNFAVGNLNGATLTSANSIITIGSTNMEGSNGAGTNIIAFGNSVMGNSADMAPNNSIGMGSEALRLATSLQKQIAIGYRAGYSNTFTTGVHIGYLSNSKRNNEISLGSSTYTYGRWDITGQVRIPTGTTAQRATAEAGDFRFNSTLAAFEGYNGTTWSSFATGGSDTNLGITDITFTGSRQHELAGYNLQFNTPTVTQAFYVDGTYGYARVAAKFPSNGTALSVTNTGVLTSTPALAVYGQITTVSPTGSGYNPPSYVGSQTQVYHTLASGNINSMQGVYARVGYNGTSTGTITSAVGVIAGLSSTGTGTRSITTMYDFRALGSGTHDIGTRYGMYVGNYVLSAGTLTNQYGLYIEDLTLGTNNIAIQTNGGQVKFLGTSATTIHVGTTGERPTGASGMVRFNSTDAKLEYYDGSTWVQPGTGGSDTNAFNTDLTSTGHRIHDIGTNYWAIDSSASSNALHIVGLTGNVGIKTVPAYSLHISGTDAMLLPKGTVAQRPGTTTAGLIRFNTDDDVLEYHDGTSWTSVGNGIYAGSGSLSSSTTVTAASNDFIISTTGDANTLNIDGATGNVGIQSTPATASELKIGGTNAVELPGGTSAQRPGTPVNGMIRNNTLSQSVEIYTDSDWHPIQQTLEIVTTTSGVTVTTYKNTFIYADISTTSQTVTLSPGNLAVGSTVEIMVTTTNDFTLDSDTGNFIDFSGSSATKAMTAGYYKLIWNGTDFYFI